MLQRKYLIEQHKRLNWQYRMYGPLYNWHAVNDPKGIIPTDYNIPSVVQFNSLNTSLSPNAGNKLKSERRINHPEGGNWTVAPMWNFHISGIGTDDVNFAGLPAGIRSGVNGSFSAIQEYALFWTKDEQTGNPSNASFRRLNFNNGSFDSSAALKSAGCSVRFIRTLYGNEVFLADGTFLEVARDIIGNDYQIIKIGEFAWSQRNLQTTRFNDGTPIPNVTDNTAWINATTAAYCHYNNNPNNSFLTHLP